MEPYIQVFINLFITLAVGGLILILVKRFFQSKQAYPYYKNPYFISKSERAFFKVLESIVGDKYYICPQVNIHSLIRVEKIEGDEKKYWSFFNKISKKSVDFVLVNRETFEPVLAIELDDLSHSLYSRSERDTLVNEAFKAAKIPLLRVKAAYSYNISEITKKIETTMNSAKITSCVTSILNTSATYLSSLSLSFLPATLIYLLLTT